MNKWLGSGAYDWKAHQSPSEWTGHLVIYCGHSPRLLRFLLLRRRLQDIRSTRIKGFAVERAIAADPDLTLLSWLAAGRWPFSSSRLHSNSKSLALSKRFKGCWASWPQRFRYFSWACFTFSTGWNLDFFHTLGVTDASVSRWIRPTALAPWKKT